MARCYCCSIKPFSECCEPFLSRNENAGDAEKLMRSRYSAYCINNYQYILGTYGELQQKGLTSSAFEQSAGNTKWLGLQVVKHLKLDDHNATVEFIATYAEHKKLYKMHEVSSFELQKGQWRYTSGVMQKETGKIKISRNSSCPCQSGKKFKQCCMSKI